VNLRRDEIDAMIAEAGASTVVERLTEFLTPPRRERIEQVLGGRLFGVHVAVEEPYDPHNAAAVVRSAEAFGAACVHVIAASERVLRSKRTTAGTHHWVETRNHADLGGFFAEVRERGMVVAAACVEEQSDPPALDLEELPVERPICLLFGNEHRGLSPAARSEADLRFHIHTHGFAESLNLSVSAAISLYATTRRRRTRLGRDSDLSDSQRDHERARWYLRSVDERLARGLFATHAKQVGE
jgi:tRNA (guanosine-2'-O-)-methyltransferase